MATATKSGRTVLPPMNVLREEFVASLGTLKELATVDVITSDWQYISLKENYKKCKRYLLNFAAALSREGATEEKQLAAMDFSEIRNKVEILVDAYKDHKNEKRPISSTIFSSTCTENTNETKEYVLEDTSVKPKGHDERSFTSKLNLKMRDLQIQHEIEKLEKDVKFEREMLKLTKEIESEGSRKDCATPKEVLRRPDLSHLKRCTIDLEKSTRDLEDWVMESRSMVSDIPETQKNSKKDPNTAGRD